jgi:phospholipase C
VKLFYRARLVSVTVALVLAAAVLVSVQVLTGTQSQASGAVKTAAPATATPIKHLVVIFQENSSFDHYFGTYPDAANPPGEPAFHATPGTPKVNGLTPELLTDNPNSANPQRLDRSDPVTCDNNHGYTAEQKAYDNGKVDQFVQETGNADPNCQPGLVMDYYDGNTVTGLWNYAQNFAMSDNSYGTTYGPSTPGAINLISGNTHGAQMFSGQPASPNGTLISNPTAAWEYCGGGTAASVQMMGRNIGDLLNNDSVSWGWFSGGFTPTSRDGNGIPTCGSSHENVGGADVGDYCNICEPFQYYASTANPAHLPPSSIDMIGRTDQANHQYDLTDFWAAADNGNLPAVSFLKAPGYEQGHPEISDPLDEQQFLVNTINHLEREKTWKSTAVVIAWDDSDGWYDHVMPPLVNPSQSTQDALTGTRACGTGTPLNGYQDRCGYGPRLPLLVVSPYSKVNYVDHTVTDQTSIIRFIEDNWLGGERIGDGAFDALAGSLDGMFDFKHPTAHRLFLDAATGEPVNPVKITPSPAPSYSTYPSPPPSPTPSPSASDTIPPGAIVAPDVADAYVYLINPITNYGSNISIRVKPGVMQSYLRFDVTGLRGTVTNAYLRIYANSNGTDLTAYTLASNDWEENTITWDNAPAFATQLGTAKPVVGGTWVDVDVTAAVQADGLHDFGLQTTGSQINLASRNDTAGHAPQLIIQTTG